MIIIGKVIKGTGEASRLFDLPTANLILSSSIDAGSYTANAIVKEKSFPALAYSGIDLHKLEVHLFGFSGDLLGETLSVELLQKIGEHVEFESIEQIKTKIREDVKTARQVLCLPE